MQPICIDFLVLHAKARVSIALRHGRSIMWPVFGGFLGAEMRRVTGQVLALLFELCELVPGESSAPAGARRSCPDPGALRPGLADPGALRCSRCTPASRCLDAVACFVIPLKQGRARAPPPRGCGAPQMWLQRAQSTRLERASTTLHRHPCALLFPTAAAPDFVHPSFFGFFCFFPAQSGARALDHVASGASGMKPAGCACVRSRSRLRALLWV